MSFVFDSELHKYTLDGVELPSVTHICRFLHYKAEYADKALRDIARLRGTAIHELTALMDYGEDILMEHELAPYVNGWSDFKRDYRAVPTHIEVSLHCPTFAGTIDRICEINGKNIVVDIKTGSTVNKTALQAQLTGYALLCHSNGIVVDGMAGVYLNRKGGYSVYHATQDTELFLALIKLHEREERNKKRWKNRL